MRSTQRGNCKGRMSSQPAVNTSKVPAVMINRHVSEKQAGGVRLGGVGKPKDSLCSAYAGTRNKIVRMPTVHT